VLTPESAAVAVTTLLIRRTRNLKQMLPWAAGVTLLWTTKVLPSFSPLGFLKMRAATERLRRYRIGPV
jgi:hypothetical protein